MKKSLIAAVTLSAVVACGYASASVHGGHHHNGHGFSPFAEYDTDKDGALNAEEVKTMKAKLTERADRHQKELVSFEKADADKNGFITVDELAVIMPKPEQAKTDASPAKEKNGDKAKTKAEAKAGVKPGADRNMKGRHGKFAGKHGKHHGHKGFRKHGGFGMDPVMFVMHGFDANHDYKLDRNEYAKFTEAENMRINAEKQFITALDAADLNGDGYVTYFELDNVSHGMFLKNAPAFKPQPAAQGEDYDNGNEEEEEFEDQE